MKTARFAIAALIALPFLLGGCVSSRPYVNECIVTVGVQEFREAIDSCLAGEPEVARECIATAYYHFHLADCIEPDGTPFVRSIDELDSMYAYTAQDRNKILQWINRNCGRR